MQGGGKESKNRIKRVKMGIIATLTIRIAEKFAVENMLKNKKQSRQFIKKIKIKKTKK